MAFCQKHYYTVFESFKVNYKTIYCTKERLEKEIIKLKAGSSFLLIHESDKPIDTVFNFPQYYSIFSGVEMFRMQGYKTIQRLLENNDSRRIDSMADGIWIGVTVSRNKIEYNYIIEIQNYRRHKATSYVKDKLSAIVFYNNDGMMDSSYLYYYDNIASQKTYFKRVGQFETKSYLEINYHKGTNIVSLITDECMAIYVDKKGLIIKFQTKEEYLKSFEE